MIHNPERSLRSPPSLSLPPSETDRLLSVFLSAKFHPLVSIKSLTWERGEKKKATVSKSFVLFPQTAALPSPAQGFSHLLTHSC